MRRHAYMASILAVTAATLTVAELARRWITKSTKRTEILEDDEPTGFYPRNEIIWGLAKAIFTSFGRLNWHLGNFELLGVENIKKAINLEAGIVYAIDHRSSADVFISQLILWLAGFKNLAEEIFLYVIGLRFINRHPFFSIAVRGGPRVTIVQPTMIPSRPPAGADKAAREDWRRQAEVARRIINDAKKWVWKFLDEGRWVFISLEGTRSRKGPMVEAAAAAASLIRREGSYILPVALEGTEKMWPIGAKLPHPFTRIRVIVGEPVSVEDLQERAKILHERFGVSEDRAFVDLIMREIALLHIRLGDPKYAGYYSRSLEEIYEERR